MAAPASAVERLCQDLADYEVMYQLGLEQRDCIAREDLEGLAASFQRTRQLMDRIRLRQEGSPGPGREPGEATQREAVRRLLGRLQELRRDNEAAVQGLLARTREEVRQFQQGRRALRGYQKAGLSEARFIDHVR
ncbi:MAG: flagellar protein FliT [Candidatus Latescibacteria bacterium]|nr:flagellar protein FliT [Candidatus Latescibacterota bacterium]